MDLAVASTYNEDAKKALENYTQASKVRKFAFAYKLRIFVIGMLITFLNSRKVFELRMVYDKKQLENLNSSRPEEVGRMCLNL